MRILLIHGRSQQEKEVEVLKQEWVSSLKKGFEDACLTFPEDIEIDFPYFGDTLIELQNEYEKNKDATSYRMKATGTDEEDEVSKLQNMILQQILDKQDLSGLPKIKEEIKEYIAKDTQNHPIVIAAAKVLDQFRFSGNLAIVGLFADIAAYLSVDDIREKVNTLVRKKISSNTDIVIAHSLGTIVAYNLLRALDPKLHQIKLFITLGSPLGIDAIKRQLDKPLINPACLQGEWLNFYDEHDIVALNPLNHEHFMIDPVIQNFEIKNSSDNKHNISEYINDNLVASKINQLYQKEKHSLADQANGKIKSDNKE